MTETGRELYLNYEMEISALKSRIKEVKSTKDETNEKSVKKSIKNIKKMVKEVKEKKKFVSKLITDMEMVGAENEN